MKIRRLLIAGVFAAMLAAPALADLTYTQGAGTTIFDFICFSTKHCSAHVPVNSAGTEIATSGNPLRVDPTGTTTQPVSSTTLSTAANQTSELTKLDTIITNTGAAIPAGTATIGNFGSDPSSGKGTPSSVAINVSTATTTQLVAISGSAKIYVTSFDVIAGGTGNITFVYGTGSNCGTGTTSLTGGYNLIAQAGIAKGSGVAAVLGRHLRQQQPPVIPSRND